MQPAAQVLRVLEGAFVVERAVAGTPPDDDWIALVRAPEGLTVVRRVADGLGDGGGADAESGLGGGDGDLSSRNLSDGDVAGGDTEESWRAFYGDAAHGLDLPGVLLAVIRPLSESGVPIFVASTYDADLVLVPATQLERARRLLVAAGHEVRDERGDARPPGAVATPPRPAPAASRPSASCGR